MAAMICHVSDISGPAARLEASDDGLFVTPRDFLFKIIDKPLDRISIFFFCFLGNYHRIIFKYLTLF